MTASATDGGGDVRLDALVRDLLGDQSRLTAVERFAAQHAAPAEPRLAAVYRDLIPLNAPRQGEQYAFEVDLDACSGCKSCVAACHALNGLEDGESWRGVGALTGVEGSPGGKASAGAPVGPLLQTVTTACHHCVEPACLLGCPVNAYEKDAVTGIVRHLDDQCIGCTYCILKCPYEVPKFSARLGIVRKCDMCHGRLAAGEAPACVQSCPSSAIRITTVSKAWAPVQFRPPNRSESPKLWLPDAPDPSYTLPTTRYLTARDGSRLRAADQGALQPQPAHAPLVALLLLTQAGAGMFAAGAVLGPDLTAVERARLFGAAWVAAHAGLAASVAHLGRPSGAWRAFLGWRTSWMSREVLAFGFFSGAATLAAGAAVAGTLGTAAFGRLAMMGFGSGVLAAGAGLLAVAASAMVYVDTPRPGWRAVRTFPRFFSSAAALGGAGAGCASRDASAGAFALAAVAVWLAVTLAERLGARRILRQPNHPCLETARLTFERFQALDRFQRSAAWAALACGIPGIILPGWRWPALAFVAASTVAERILFFRTAAAKRMPGLP